MSTLRTTAFQLASLALFIGSATQAMADALTDCGLPVHLEVWGSDVSHDWYWWGKEFGMFAERLFG